MKKLNRVLLFARVLVTSAINFYRITRRLEWRMAVGVIKALFCRVPVDTRPGRFWWRRMRACQRCPIYDRERRTCGRLGQGIVSYHGDPIPLGCGCFMPLKAALPNAKCWLHEMTNGAKGTDWRFGSFWLRLQR
ncbi:MAG: hypothetical protein AB9869_18110 [Verrucomicrobiia bacterium]